MAVLMKDIIDAMEELAPSALAMADDNIGLLIGGKNRQISSVLVALEATEAIVAEAIELGVDAVIVHHPLIFSPIKRICEEDSVGRRIAAFIKNDICLLVSHTNFDAVDGGVNDIFCQHMGFVDIEKIMRIGDSFFGRSARLPRELDAAPLDTVAKHISRRLGLDFLQFCCYNIENSKTNKIAISCGSTASPEFFKMAIDAGCDTFITSDIKYHMAQTALEMGLKLIDATHLHAENLAMEKLYRILSDKFSNRGVKLNFRKTADPFKVALVSEDNYG